MRYLLYGYGIHQMLKSKLTKGLIFALPLSGLKQQPLFSHNSVGQEGR